MANYLTPEIKTFFQKGLGSKVLFDEKLAPYVAYQIGGPADILVFPEEESDLVTLCAGARQFNLPLTIIGTGTNLLVHDDGIRGITVHLKDVFNTIRVEKQWEDKVQVQCGAGVLKSELLRWAIERGWAGLEFSSGVPGTLGGGIFMNAGTKYGCYGDILREIRLFDFDTGPIQIWANTQDFGYRHQHLVTSRRLVLWASLELRRGDTVALTQEVNRIIAERAEKQPLDYPSCGSTFKNPPGHSAGRLIERAGLKGLKVGGAQISTKHANFILNIDGATSQDIQTLIRTIQNKIAQEFGVQLETEVVLVGGNSVETPIQN